jgi:A/G-specific adenine glycosylase
MTGAEVRRLRRAMLAWFRRCRRDLPWRRTRDPYAIWVAEIMLQQTRVAAVVPHYARFLERFPDVRALARAREDAVLAAWSGLGYYRRARALRAAAIEVRERHAGRVPADPAELLLLPGIGRYTAGAIASQAFGAREPVVDGNVRRVLSRIFGLAGRRASDASLWTLARRLVDGDSPGDWNQALMELGALVCTARSPACARCPVASRCAALASGDPERIPRPRRAVRIRKLRVAVALVARRGRVLLERPAHGNPLRGTWDLPAVVIEPGSSPRPMLEAGLALRGLRCRAGDEVARASHAILDRSLALEVYACRALGEPPPGAALRWASPGILGRVPVSGATQKILRAAAQGVQSPDVGTRKPPSVPRP